MAAFRTAARRHGIRYQRLHLLAGAHRRPVRLGALLPRWERYPVTSHARPYNAKLARSGRFDSAVVGSSTSMLLRPTELNAEFGGNFVNLGMPAASPYEQLRVLDLLGYTGAYDGTLIVGLDPSWCAPDGSPRLLRQMMGQTFPESLYDDDIWNDLPPFNQKTLQHARSQLLALLGLRVRHPLRPDGYRDFTLTFRTDNDLRLGPQAHLRRGALAAAAHGERGPAPFSRAGRAGGQALTPAGRDPEGRLLRTLSHPTPAPGGQRATASLVRVQGQGRRGSQPSPERGGAGLHDPFADYDGRPQLRRRPALHHVGRRRHRAAFALGCRPSR